VSVMPPQINKYYVFGLAPGRSLAEHLVSHGHQVFMVSWRNPGPSIGSGTSIPTWPPCSTATTPPWRSPARPMPTCSECVPAA
jgi:hypothetical protein